MRRNVIPAEQLDAWARLNGIECEAVEVITNPKSDTEAPKGAGLVAKCDVSANENHEILVAVPQDLILSQEQVIRYAVIDEPLKAALDAASAFGQITHASSDFQIQLSAPNPHTDYVQLLPANVTLPTFYTEEEKQLLSGTSLQHALDQKMRSLEKEFDELQKSTQNIPWCQSYWWGEEDGKLTFEDWMTVDALYRSRALDLPGTGHAMVPYLDMANHAAGAEATASYDTDGDGRAILHLLPGRQLTQGQEVAITYGDEKGASEMIFSYGFLEWTMSSARVVFLDLDLPDDDPLQLAKKSVNEAAPGVRLSIDCNGNFRWASDYIWWSTINEEDGLEFQLVQENDGSRRLDVLWKNQRIDPSLLPKLLTEDPRWDIFCLRAVVLLQERVERQLMDLYAGNEVFSASRGRSNVRDEIWALIQRLRNLEQSLFVRFCEYLDDRKKELLRSRIVTAYLEAAEATQAETGQELPASSEIDDFS